jgi:exopolyphosphatase/guanosine-5'-triphosphate,3'-diphosphate pyrophosphatase
VYLGSHRFHLFFDRVDDVIFTVVDRIKEMVRLGGGLDEDNELSDEAQTRALQTLSRFGERIRHMPPHAVRVVGTNTMRRARNSKHFAVEARRAIGHPIEIVSGREEARLIYLGVAQGNYDEQAANRLVVDIGGGSTEVIIGRQMEVIVCESLYMGCVSYSKQFFPDGKLTLKRFKSATLAARQEIRSIETSYPGLGWQTCFGASGTIKAVLEVLTQNDLGSMQITLEGMLTLRDRMIDVGDAYACKLEGLKEDRVPVFHGGLAILIGLFESLGIEHMAVSDFAMREGVMFDLHGRIKNEDTRDATIATLATRYNIDQPHASRVLATALNLFERVQDVWGLDSGWHKRLVWGCQLHEIGVAIAHSRHHKHGSYIVENSDMAGFSRQDQQLMWALIRTHRRAFKSHRFDGLPEAFREGAMRICILMRLAVLLNRSRSMDVPRVNLEAKLDKRDRTTLTLTFPTGWLENAPLTREDLLQEVSYLDGSSFRLRVQ